MSNTTGANLLRVDNDRSEPVGVREIRSGSVSEARIDDDCILREVDGAGAYSEGAYEVLPPEQSKKVVITQNSHANVYHTTNCRNFKDFKRGQRKIVMLIEATNFYNISKECGWCQKKSDMSSEEIEALVEEANGSI